MAIDHRRFVAEYDASILPYMQGMEKMSAAHRRWRQESVGGFKDVDNHATKTIGTMRTLLLATTALGGGAVLLAMTRYTDTAKQMDNQLRAIGATTEALQKQVFNLAINTRSPIESTVGLLRNMQKSLKDQDLERTIRQVGTLNRLLTIGGLDQAARGSVALQFGQALQSGVLAGDELRALREAAPIELLEAIAKAAGGTVESLRKLGSEGKLTRDVMVQALDDLEATSKEKFGNFKMTMAEASEAVRTALVATAGHFDKGLGVTSRIAQAEQALASFMMENAESAETLGRAFRMVLDAALVLAGSRGLLLLGSRFMAVRAEITALGVAMRGINVDLALFGGPWGLAMFAAGMAIIGLTRHVDSFNDVLSRTGDALSRLEDMPRVFSSITDDIRDDLDRLRKAEEAVTAAIESQGIAAQIAAEKERDAIRGRIAANRELLQTKIAVAQDDLQTARQGVDGLFDILTKRISINIQRDDWRAAGRPTGREEYFIPSRARVEQALADEIARIRAKDADARSRAERQMLKDYQEYLDRKQKLADDEIKIEQMVEEARARAQTILQTGGDASVAESVFEEQRKAAAAAVEEADALLKRVREISENRRAFADMEEKVAGVRAILDGYTFDDDAKVRSAVGLVAKALEEARKKVDDLDKASMDGLKQQVQGLISLLDQLVGGIGLTRESLQGGGLSYGPSRRPRNGAFSRGAREAAAGGILSLIGYAEGTARPGRRGYNETLDFGRWTGGDRNLINMSLNEVMALQGQMLANPENRARYGNGRGSSALGMYQITRATLRDYLMPTLGLTGDELFDEDLQDRMAQQLLRRRRGQGLAGLRNEWEGLRNIPGSIIEDAMSAQSIGLHDPAVARGLEEETRAREEATRVRREYIETAEEEAARREFEISILGKTASEQAYLTTKFELMNRAKRDGIDLDEQIAGSTRTYREEIEALAKAAEADIRSQERRAKAIENAEQKTEFLNQVNRELKDGILDAILEADNFSDALGNVARMLARAALEAALFGDGPLARSDNSGGLFGSLLDGLGAFFQNRFAVGGIMTSSGPLDLPVRMYSAGGIANTAQMAIFGEGSTPEAYVPLPDGRSIPVTLRMPDLDRLAAVGGSTAAPVGLSVNIYENAAEEAHEVSYSPQEGRLDIFLKRTVSDMIDSGAMDKSMSNRFGLRPSAKGR